LDLGFSQVGWAADGTAGVAGEAVSEVVDSAAEAASVVAVEIPAAVVLAVLAEETRAAAVPTEAGRS
jgi:hypothetical protein